MAQRLILQSALEAILGSRNVYFQPPSGFQMQYPCIVYTLDNDFVARADNKIYHGMAQVSGKSMKLSGCVAGGLICKTQTWTRLK